MASASAAVVVAELVAYHHPICSEVGQDSRAVGVTHPFTNPVSDALGNADALTQPHPVSDTVRDG